MRPGQNRRMRGRNNAPNGGGGNRKAPNPLQRSYESNGPDVKVRGTAQHVAEKYLQLARDAQSSGDPVAAENYFQHAEHYYRILLAAQEQMAQQFGHSFPPNRAFGDNPDDGDEDGDEDGGEFQPGNGPQPEMRGDRQGGQRQDHQRQDHQRQDGNREPRQDGEGGDGQQNGQRYERQPRQNFDRPQGDRPQGDRNQGDRNQNRRFDRPERGERQDRGDRQDRGERRFDRPEGQQGGYVPRSDAPRSEIPAGEQPEAQPQPRFERPERQDRPERGPRPERRPRRDFDDEANGQPDVAASLPSFLTTPVRVPVAPVEQPVAAPEPASEPAAELGTEAPKRPRRRRSPREVMDALGSDAENVTE